MRHRDGLFARRAAAFHQCEAGDLPALWREMHRRHVEQVLAHFAGNPRFLHFRVDRDDVKVLIDLLAPDFRLKRRYWQKRNVSGQAPKRSLLERLKHRLEKSRRSFA